MKISVLRGSSMNQQANRTGEISHQEKNAGHGFSRVGFLDLLLFVQTVSASKNKIKKKTATTIFTHSPHSFVISLVLFLPLKLKFISLCSCVNFLSIYSIYFAFGYFISLRSLFVVDPKRCE